MGIDKAGNDIHTICPVTILLQGSRGGVCEMLVICEDCAKKYNIDESRIKGEKAKFTCKECGHIIVVEKPELSADKPAPDREGTPPAAKDQDTAGSQSAPGSTLTAATAGTGMPISGYLLLTLVTGFLAITATFAYLYLQYIPKIINQQIELRTLAITKSFSGVIKKPLLLRNYLQVNKEAKRTSQLPGVAYAAVVNKKGIVIAGFFSDLERFDNQFKTTVQQKGFPVDRLAQNKLPPGEDTANSRIMMGGQTIFDEVVSIPDTGGEVHVGIYVSEVDNAIKNALVSPLTISLIGGVLIVGFIVLLILTRAITRPMQELTDVANRISLGELDLEIKPSGPREMRQLAAAFDRMRYSIKTAMDRLRK